MARAQTPPLRQRRHRTREQRLAPRDRRLRTLAGTARSARSGHRWPWWHPAPASLEGPTGPPSEQRQGEVHLRARGRIAGEGHSWLASEEPSTPNKFDVPQSAGARHCWRAPPVPWPWMRVSQRVTGKARAHRRRRRSGSRPPASWSWHPTGGRLNGERDPGWSSLSPAVAGWPRTSHRSVGHSEWVGRRRPECIGMRQNCIGVTGTQARPHLTSRPMFESADTRRNGARLRRRLAGSQTATTRSPLDR